MAIFTSGVSAVFLFIYFWLCWVWVAARGLSLVVRGLLMVVASLVVEHGL